MTAFDSLPFMAIVDDAFLVVHGGLCDTSTKLTIDDIQKIDRFVEPAENSTLSQFLWSDPQEWDGYSKKPSGDGCLFGPDC